MGKLQSKIITVALLASVALPTVAADDFGASYSLGAEHKISKKASVGAEVELRTRNDSKTLDRWSFGADVEYKLCKPLKLSVGYNLLYDNNLEKITRADDGEALKWRPSHWGFRSRFNLSLTGSVDVGRFSLSLRERYQFTFRPEKTVDRYDFVDKEWETDHMGSKRKHVLRSKAEVDYNIRHCAFTPFANAELFNGLQLDKARFQVGTSYKIGKRHVLKAYYQYQVVNDDDDDNETNSHLVGLSYKFKF